MCYYYWVTRKKVCSTKIIEFMILQAKLPITQGRKCTYSFYRKCVTSKSPKRCATPLVHAYQVRSGHPYLILLCKAPLLWALAFYYDCIRALLLNHNRMQETLGPEVRRQIWIDCQAGATVSSQLTHTDKKSATQSISLLLSDCEEPSPPSIVSLLYIS